MSNGAKNAKNAGYRISCGWGVQVSALQDVTASASTTTLGNWLTACTTPMGKAAKQAAATCERIRSEPNEDQQKALKKQLPGFTPGCLLHAGQSRLEANIAQALPFVQLDIDPQDNPGLPTGEELKAILFELPFIFFCGLSTRGTGVWALVQIENPQYRQSHFDRLVRDIEGTGITVDKSKGRQPHDFRFYSYDPDALWRQDARVYSRMQSNAKVQANHRQPVRMPRAAGQSIGRDALGITDRYKFEGTPLQAGGKVTANGNTNRVKHECPRCGRMSFVRVVDTYTGDYMPFEFGSCDHKNSCDYMQPVTLEHHKSYTKG